MSGLMLVALLGMGMLAVVVGGSDGDDADSDTPDDAIEPTEPDPVDPAPVTAEPTTPVTPDPTALPPTPLSAPLESDLPFDPTPPAV